MPYTYTVGIKISLVQMVFCALWDGRRGVMSSRQGERSRVKTDGSVLSPPPVSPKAYGIPCLYAQLTRRGRSGAGGEAVAHVCKEPDDICPGISRHREALCRPPVPTGCCAKVLACCLVHRGRRGIHTGAACLRGRKRRSTLHHALDTKRKEALAAVCAVPCAYAMPIA
jgi:hypothetical protein